MPKILLWDIETAPNIAAIWSLWDKYTSPNQILQERYIICASFKELGAKKVTSVSLLDDRERFNKDPTDDTYVVEKIHSILFEADAVIAHNGDQYDMKVFNSRAIQLGLPPLPEIVQEDTLKMAKRKFKFNSNKLDYLANLLGIGGKIDTDIELWKDCMLGKVRAIRDMVKYNKHDVELLEKVFIKLAPFTGTKLNHNLFTHEHVCPTCGSENLVQHGYRLTRTRKYKRYKCKECGTWSQSVLSEPDDKAWLK